MPSLREIVAIDATGETAWLWGAEDVAGDGLAVFMPQEQSIDVRTGYATTDATRFWARVYVSEPNGVGGNVIAFVFIDTDQSTSTGGSALAPEINAALASDPSPGGYERVLAIRGNGMLEGVWSWRSGPNNYAQDTIMANQFAGEAGKDLDPIRIGGTTHGYVQGAIDLDLVGLTTVCTANLFIRTVNTAPGQTAQDLDVGAAGSCVPRDDDRDRVPDVLKPPSMCTEDAQCPNHGLCSGGRCFLAEPCAIAAECASGQECSADGRCVVPPGASCANSGECGELVCRDSRCSACLPGTTECGADRKCGPDGRCVATGDIPFVLGAGEAVEGGACNCRGVGRGRSIVGAAFLVLVLVLVRARRRS